MHLPFFGGAQFTVGASAAIFGLLGALVHYGRRTGSSHVGQAGLQYALIMGVLGFIFPGVDNCAHLGGFAGGYLASHVLDPLKPERVDHIGDRGRAACCVTLVAIAASSVHHGLATWQSDPQPRSRLPASLDRRSARVEVRQPSGDSSRHEVCRRAVDVGTSTTRSRREIVWPSGTQIPSATVSGTSLARTLFALEVLSMKRWSNIIWALAAVVALARPRRSRKAAARAPPAASAAKSKTRRAACCPA